MYICWCNFEDFCNKEDLPQEWKESIIVPIYKKGDKIRQILKKKWEYIEAVHQRESLWFDEEGGLVQYSHWVWHPHETGKANKNVSEWNL